MRPRRPLISGAVTQRSEIVYTAKWWTQGEDPRSGGDGSWTGVVEGGGETGFAVVCGESKIARTRGIGFLQSNGLDDRGSTRVLKINLLAFPRTLLSPSLFPQSALSVSASVCLSIAGGLAVIFPRRVTAETGGKKSRGVERGAGFAVVMGYFCPMPRARAARIRPWNSSPLSAAPTMAWVSCPPPNPFLLTWRTYTWILAVPHIHPPSSPFPTHELDRPPPASYRLLLVCP